jgi:hypothetical protein
MRRTTEGTGTSFLTFDVSSFDKNHHFLKLMKFFVMVCIRQNGPLPLLLLTAAPLAADDADLHHPWPVTIHYTPPLAGYWLDRGVRWWALHCFCFL